MIANARPASHPLMCTVSQAEAHGGIARVSRLVADALRVKVNDELEVVEMIRDGKNAPSMTDKISFARRVLGCYARRDINWVMYDHINIARLQNRLPLALKRPFAVFLYSVDVWNELSPSHLRALKEAQVRIAISHHTAQRVALRHGDVGCINVCHLALQPKQERLASISTPELLNALTANERQVLKRVRNDSALIVGRMWSVEQHKGHDALIEVWAEIIKSLPYAQLVVVGDGDDRPRLQRKADVLGIGDNVLFTGKVSENLLEAVYRHVGFFAMPSRGEGFGLVYLEAMNHRLACVGSPEDAAAEIIESGKTGLLIAQSDKRQLHEGLVRLITDEALRREMGIAGYNVLQARFSVQAFNDNLHTILTAASLTK